MSNVNMKKELPAGTELFREGDLSVETYLLMSGEVEVLKDDKVVTTISETGTFIGEMGTLLGIPRTATIRTKTDCIFIIINPVDFEKIIQQQPSIAFKLCKVLAIRLQNTTLEMLKLKGQVNGSHSFETDTPVASVLTETEDVEALLFDANKAYKNKDFNTAIEKFTKLLQYEGENAEVISKLANAYYNNGDLTNAIKNMKKSVDLMPKYEKFRNNLAVFYYKNGDKDLAINEWEEVLKIDPGNQKAKSNLEKLKK
mgnify:CR=1 FL=1